MTVPSWVRFPGFHFSAATTIVGAEIILAE
jgi:hypothetical protein